MTDHCTAVYTRNRRFEHPQVDKSRRVATPSSLPPTYLLTATLRSYTNEHVLVWKKGVAI